ncbi:hypothetical protein D3C78_1366780 [compost metagenome]
MFVVLTVFHAQQRLGQAVVAVHDLRQEVALDAIQAAVDLGFDVTMGGHHLVVAGGDHHAATGATETAGRLVPVQGDHVRFSDQVTGGGVDRQAGRRGSNGGSLGFGEFTAGHAHSISPAVSRSSW